MEQVLDQSIRILQASIDVLAELGYLSSCMMMMTLMQCIKQARWPEDGPLAALPGIEVELERKRIEEGNGNASPGNLAELTIMPRPDLERLMRLVEVPNASQASVRIQPLVMGCLLTNFSSSVLSPLSLRSRSKFRKQPPTWLRALSSARTPPSTETSASKPPNSRSPKRKAILLFLGM